MEFRILGALEAWSGQVRLPLGGARERKVLAILLLEANRTVPLGHLVDALWEDAPPATAEKQVRNAVSRLRSVIAAGPGETGDITAVSDAGYCLTVAEGALDAAEFEREVAQAEAAADDGDLTAAAALLRTALGRWRGPALAGMTGRMIEAGAAAWDERRLAVQEAYTDHQLALGRHAQVIADLSALVAEHPFREKAVCQLMLALHRGGRQSEALAAYHGLRSRLADGMGLDPGPALHHLHQQILTNDPAIAAPQTPPSSPPPAAPQGLRPGGHVVPRQLPTAVSHFTGRRRHLKLLDELLGRTAEFGGGTAVISAIGGSAGIGKSALAVHWGQANTERFPDGQLHVNLRGFAPGARPVTPTEATRGFLEALGVPAHRIPQELDGQTALYRSLVAGRRMLIVLDNARDTEQVRPLLPGTPSCMVLVTSRNQLAGLVAAEGATPVTLDLLSACESHDLLSRRLGPERTAAEPRATAELIELCARLPLALSIAAARAIVTPGMSLTGLAGALRDVRDRLDTLDIGDATTDVRAVFSWSYEHLSEPTARMFRLLSVHPGPDITVPAAASLTGTAAGDARRALADLARARLVVEHTPGRYTFHDLLRVYATELAGRHDSDEQRRAAVLRITDHYLHTVQAADRLISADPVPPTATPPHPGATPEHFADAAQGAHWMEAEHQVLAAAVTLADGHGLDTRSSRLVWLLMRFFDQRATGDAPPAGRAAPRPPQPDRGRARVHWGLGPNYAWLVGYPNVLASLQRFAGVFRDLEDSTGLAHTHFGICSVFESQKRYAEALEHARRALELFTTVGHRPGQARSRNAVGWLLGRLGDHGAALAYYESALDLYRDLGDETMQAVVWDNTGQARHGLGRYPQAVAAYEQALALTRARGDAHEEAITLGHLADTYQAVGDETAAAAARAGSLAIFDRLDGLG